MAGALSQRQTLHILVLMMTMKTHEYRWRQNAMGTAKGHKWPVHVNNVGIVSLRGVGALHHHAMSSAYYGHEVLRLDACLSSRSSDSGFNSRHGRAVSVGFELAA